MANDEVRMRGKELGFGMRVRRFTQISQISREGMPQLLAVLILLLASLQPLSARTYKEIPELAKVFSNNGVAGTFVLFDVAADTMFVSDEASREETLHSGFNFQDRELADWPGRGCGERRG